MMRPRMGMGYVHGGPFKTRWLLRGLVARIAATAAIAAGGLVFIILYLGFFAVHYPWYENLAVVLSTTVLVPVVLLAIWLSWGLGVSRRYIGDFE